MTVREQFRERLARQPSQFAAPHLLPVRLARTAAAIVTGVAAAGIEVITPDGLRIPVGPSSPAAATAERLEFTAGAGPCLLAAQTGRPVFAPADRMALRWPWLFEQLRTRTPFRAVLAVPLRQDAVTFGSVNLHLTDPTLVGVPPRVWSTAHVVADEIAAALTGAPAGGVDGHAAPQAARFGPDQPAWLDSPPAQGRQLVWIAIGMLSAHLHLAAADALARLRSVASARGQDLDQYAADLVHRTTPLPDRDS